MKSITISILLIALAAFSGAQDSSQYHYLHKVVSFLASDSMKGRACGSEEEKMVAEFLFNEMSQINGCKVSNQPFQFSKDSTTYKSINVIGFIDNKSEQTIVLSAHYDHLGTGGPLSHSKGSIAIHNGADDNASGVALMLNLAQDLSKKDSRYNYLFLAHSGHELGLYGSKNFLEHSSQKYSGLYLCVNFDMVGRRSENKVYYDCSTDIEESINLQSTEDIIFSKSVFNRIQKLDTKWFVEQNIPAVTISTGQHLDYHRTTDDLEYIDFDGIAQLEKALLDWLNNLSF